MKTPIARMAKMLPPSHVRAPPALWFVLLRVQTGFQELWMTAAPGTQTFLLQSPCPGQAARSQPVQGPWSSSSPFGLFTAIPRNLDYLVSSMPCMGTPPLAEEPQAGCWYMQQTSDVLQSPGFACQNHRIFQAHNHCSRQLRLLGTVCLMLLQALIKWNKFHHSPLKSSIPLFFQNMSAGCWQIPDVAALMLNCCQESPAAHVVLTFLALLANFVSFPAAPEWWKRIPYVHAEVHNSGAEPAIPQGSRLVTHCMNCCHSCDPQRNFI